MNRIEFYGICIALGFPSITSDWYKGILECLLVCSLQEYKYEEETQEEVEMATIRTKLMRNISEETHTYQNF